MRCRTVLVSLSVLLLACGDDGRESTIFSSSAPTTMGDGPEPTTDDESGPSTGDGDPSTGDGDPSTGDGDGDPSTGDGDGDPSGDGDGDGDPSTGDGDPSTGDGDPTGDGDANPCGNGVIDPGEECDGGNLGGSSCVDHDFDGGVLGCDPTVCIFDTSGCTNEPSNDCDAFCGGCSCPSFECTMCCANLGKVDTCGGGSCGCF